MDAPRIAFGACSGASRGDGAARPCHKAIILIPRVDLPAYVCEVGLRPVYVRSQVHSSVRPLFPIVFELCSAFLRIHLDSGMLPEFPTWLADFVVKPLYHR